MKVTLCGLEPAVWRRFEVPAHFDLRRLHAVLQELMGWTDSHLHQFQVGGEAYAVPYPDSFGGARDSRKITVGALVAKGVRRFLYEYDFGDSWEHEIEIEEVTPGGRELHPVCLDGKRACPPDDCGGPGGYEELLEAIRDPRKESHKEMLEWLGDPFDPEKFDLGAVNRALRRL